jgi:hypothetical protein
VCSGNGAVRFAKKVNEHYCMEVGPNSDDFVSHSPSPVRTQLVTTTVAGLSQFNSSVMLRTLYSTSRYSISYSIIVHLTVKLTRRSPITKARSHRFAAQGSSVGTAQIGTHLLKPLYNLIV